MNILFSFDLDRKILIIKDNINIIQKLEDNSPLKIKPTKIYNLLNGVKNGNNKKKLKMKAKIPKSNKCDNTELKSIIRGIDIKT